MPKDWCTEADRLRDVYETVRDGGKITESRFGEDFIKYQSADLERIERDLKYAETMCATGGASTARRRYAGRISARRYR